MQYSNSIIDCFKHRRDWVKTNIYSAKGPKYMYKYVLIQVFVSTFYVV